jgi:bacillithiol synthase
MPDYNPGTMAERLRTVVDFGAFQQPLSPLFLDYLSGRESVAPFFAGGPWDLAALGAASERTLAYPHPREPVAHSLALQQRSREAPGAAELAAQLADPKSAAVVTGQQAGLFGGPLYVLYKALAARKAARLLTAERGQPVVPVFWVASDDHDFAEVRSTSVLDESGQIRTLRYTPVREPVGQPAAQIVLDETLPPLVEELGRSLPAGLHRDEVVSLVGECYRPGATLAGAFVRLLSSLLPDVVFLDPSDVALKREMVRIFEREVLEGSPTSRLAREAGERLLMAGYHQQVPVRPGFLNLFLFLGGERRALGFQNGIVEVRGLGKKLPLEDVKKMIEGDPAAWSPGVLLRPLVQDHLLPTAAYVAGPAEIAYHAQIGPSYAHFGVSRPVLVPRPSLTLVEPAQARALEAEGLKLTDLQADPESFVSRWAREAYPDVEAAFARTRETLEKQMAAVEETLAALDPTLRAATDAARGRALHQIVGLHEKSIRVLKKRDQSRAERLRRTRDALLPGGALQERGLGFLSVLARHGTSVIGEIEERMDPWAKGHQVLYL